MGMFLALRDGSTNSRPLQWVIPSNRAGQGSAVSVQSSQRHCPAALPPVHSSPQHIIQSQLKRLRSKTDNLRCKFDTLSARQKHSASIGVYFAQICFSKKQNCYFKRFRRRRYIFVTITTIIKKPVHLTAPDFSSFGRKRGQSGSLWIIYSRFFCKRMYN